jgi:hypothetical protein
MLPAPADLTDATVEGETLVERSQLLLSIGLDVRLGAAEPPALPRYSELFGADIEATDALAARMPAILLCSSL